MNGAQRAAEIFDRAFPGGVAAYAQMMPLYDVDLKEVERKTGMAKKMGLKSIASDVDAVAKEMGGTAPAVTRSGVKTTGKGKARDGGVSKGRKTMASNGANGNKPIPYSVSDTRPLDERLADILTQYPLDTVLLDLARIADNWASEDGSCDDGGELRETIVNLSSKARRVMLVKSS